MINNLEYIKKSALILGYEVFEKREIMSLGSKEWFARRPGGHAFFLMVLNFHINWDLQIKLWSKLFGLLTEEHSNIIKNNSTSDKAQRITDLIAEYHNGINEDDVNLCWRAICKSIDFIEEKNESK